MRIISYSLPVVLVGVGVLHFFLARSKKFAFKMDDFLENERQVNMSRKKDISPEFFYKPDISRLPLCGEGGNEKSARLQALVEKKAALTMIRLTEPMTNTDIKMRFGLSNLENVTNYEENYNGYVRALIDWAEALVQEGKKTEAETILLETVALQSEFSKGYYLLVDLYDSDKRHDEISNLYDIISKVDFLANNPTLKNKILNHTIDKLNA